jgi:hypothetical protein
MSTLIIRDLDEHLAVALKREAKKRALSVNRFLRQMIEVALATPAPNADSVAPDDRLRVRNDLGRLAGGWTQEDAQEFATNTQEFSVVDVADWR